MASARRAWYTVFILLIAYALAALDRIILGLMIEPLQRDLHISDTAFGLLSGFAFVVLFSVAGLPIGILADRYSRRAIIATGVALWSLMSMASGLAGSFLHLFLCRVGVGIGEASLNPSAYSLMSDLFSRDRLAKAVALYSTGGMIGAGIAFALGGSLIGFLAKQPDVVLPLVGEVRSWQLAFFISGLPGLAVALLALTIAEPRRMQSRDDAEARGSDLMVFLQTHRVFLGWHFLANTMVALLTYVLFSWGPALLMRTHLLDPGKTGLILGLATGLFGLTGFLVGGVAADNWVSRGVKHGHMRVGVIASAAVLPALLLAGLMSQTTLAVIGLLVSFMLLTAPWGASIAALQIATPVDLRARVSSLFMIATNLFGAGMGPLLIGLANDRIFLDPAAVGYSIALVGAFGTTAMFFAFRAAARAYIVID